MSGHHEIIRSMNHAYHAETKRATHLPLRSHRDPHRGDSLPHPPAASNVKAAASEAGAASRLKDQQLEAQ